MTKVDNVRQTSVCRELGKRLSADYTDYAENNELTILCWNDPMLNFCLVFLN
jgi:hypothetical protein